ncbi:MAG: WYL domain-containing protein [Bacilli bacterium]|nr:WYL domain-containing protein [Bacilli bacterium]
MPSTSNKKLSILYVLKILQDYSDENHKLMHKDIADLIYQSSGMEIERKSISASIDSLIDYNYDIVKTTRGSYLKERAFDNNELRLLIDSVLYSKHIELDSAKKLIDKLKNQGNEYFKKTIRNVNNINNIYHIQSTTQSNQICSNQVSNIFKTIDKLGQAIDENRQLKLTINEFGINKKLNPIQENIIINPYKTVYQNGFYYLIGNEDSNDLVACYRIDKISKVKILDSIAKSKEKLNIGFENLENYTSGHPYLHSGVSQYIELIIDEKDIGLVFDSFGDKFNARKLISNDNKKQIEVSLYANADDVFEWALQHGDKVEVLRPQGLRDRLRKVSIVMHSNYLSRDDDRYTEEVGKINNKDLRYTNNFLNLSFIDLRAKEDYKNLKDIESAIFAYNNISDFTFLKNYSILSSLKIAKNEIKDLSFLSELPHLYELVLIDTNIENIKFLEKCEHLEILDLYNNINIKDYSVLCKIKKLRILNISLYEKNIIEVDKIKAALPNIKINVENKYSYGFNTDIITYQMGIDDVLTISEGFKQLMEHNFYIQAYINKNNLDLERLLKTGKQQNEWVELLRKVSSLISEQEGTFLLNVHTKCKSLRNAAKEMGITIEEIIYLRKNLFRVLNCFEVADYYKEFLESIK